MSFLADGTPITKETIDEAVESLALACALGIRQHEAIVKLIEDGKIDLVRKNIPGFPGRTASYIGGVLPWSSWMGMRKRLKKAGFRVKYDEERGFKTAIRLYWGSNQDA